jgi:hypothetical protein
MISVGTNMPPFGLLANCSHLIKIAIRYSCLKVAAYRPNKSSISSRARTEDIFIRTNHWRSPCGDERIPRPAIAW